MEGRDAQRGWEPDQLDALPAWTLVRTFHALAPHLHHLFAQHGLTPPQFGVLATLAAEEPLTQAALARRVLVRPQSMHTLLRALIDRGLVTVGARRGRGRPSIPRLTPAGRELLERVRPDLERMNAPAALGLDAPNAARLNEQLHAVRRRLTPELDG